MGKEIGHHESGLDRSGFGLRNNSGIRKFSFRKSYMSRSEHTFNDGIQGMICTLRLGITYKNTRSKFGV